MTCDDNCTGASLFAFLDKIYVVKTFPFIRSFQLLGKAIVTDASGEDNRLWR